MPPKANKIGIRLNGELLIDGKNEGQHFKTGDDGSTGIRFDAQFWKNCFVGDSIKDGATRPILEGFLPASFNPEARSFTAEGIKDLSKEMITGLETNGLLIKAEITRLTHYKEGLGSDPRLQTQISTAFPEGYPIYVDKDCGLDPAYFLPNGNCIKSCNIASDIIDPHSSKTDDCAERFPKAGDTIELDRSVFEFLQYPCECSLKATTSARKGKYDNMEFLVAGENLLSSANDKKFFSGNATKNAAFSKDGSAKSKLQNMQLCSAKYSGDTLQSLIQKLFEILFGGNRTFVISTCDSVVSLRSYALNGSFIYICKDVRQEKITQIYIWRKELGNPVTLIEVFNKEKAKILAEYDCFIALVRGIEEPATQLRNIFVAGSNTTYKFTPDFYRRIVNDLTVIRTAIDNRIVIDAADANNVANIALKIKRLRMFKVNDFLKLNGPRGQLYCINMATKYTKGDLTLLDLNITKPSADGTGIEKRVSQSFFELATQRYSVRQGGSSTRHRQVMPCNMKNINEVFNTFFNMNYYNNPNEPNLHHQIVNDFKNIFETNIDKNYHTPIIFFDCFCDVINSFASLDINENGDLVVGAEYYREDSLLYLINKYFSEKTEEMTAEAMAKLMEDRFNRTFYREKTRAKIGDKLGYLPDVMIAAKKRRETETRETGKRWRQGIGTRGTGTRGTGTRGTRKNSNKFRRIKTNNQNR